MIPGIFIKDLEFCCDYSMLNLENVSILSNDEKKKLIDLDMINLVMMMMKLKDIFNIIIHIILI